MSFNTLKSEELAKACEDFGVDLSEKPNREEMIAGLVEEGITWEDYLAFNKVEDNVVPAVEVVEAAPKKAAAKKAPKDKEVLLKMTRGNPYFEVLGKVFTKEHPFVVCSEDEAQDIIDLEDGFTLATPREAAEYYS